MLSPSPLVAPQRFVSAQVGKSCLATWSDPTYEGCERTQYSCSAVYDPVQGTTEACDGDPTTWCCVDEACEGQDEGWCYCQAPEYVAPVAG